MDSFSPPAAKRSSSPSSASPPNKVKRTKRVGSIQAMKNRYTLFGSEAGDSGDDIESVPDDFFDLHPPAATATKGSSSPPTTPTKKDGSIEAVKTNKTLFGSSGDESLPNNFFVDPPNQTLFGSEAVKGGGTTFSMGGFKASDGEIESSPEVQGGHLNESGKEIVFNASVFQELNQKPPATETPKKPSARKDETPPSCEIVKVMTLEEIVDELREKVAKLEKFVSCMKSAVEIMDGSDKKAVRVIKQLKKMLNSGEYE